ncbi:MAG: Nif3-like dinuclear metal center hexameric protein [Planctomycetota bacterium]|nr:Nif3-like dinuclear metal center hexameric protein [Planctomycetota bacterium]
MAKLKRRSVTVRDLCDVMELIAPCRAAASWDNVGLLAGDPVRKLDRVMLTIDFTPDVLEEARRARVSAVVSYHPPLFRPVKRLVADPTTQEGVVAEAMASGISIYSPHTALDSAVGGTNDVLAAIAGLKDVRPFEAVAGGPVECKFVVFVPPGDVDRVADAVFDAGAGRIGAYEKCSYRLRGEGTFFGTEATDPVVGRRGRLERVDEIRLEVIVPKNRINDVAAAVRRAHSYEEPAFDVYPLERLPSDKAGQGRVGGFGRPVSLGALARALKVKTRASNTVTIGKPGMKLRRGFVCVGAAGSLPFESAGEPCGQGDVVVTGEIRHHDALRYRRCGVSAVALGHWASERPVLGPLAKRLGALLRGVAVSVSRADRDPFGSV